MSKLTSARYIREGKCVQCGNCCRNITFWVGKDAIQTEKQFDVLRNWDKRYNHFFISGKDEKGILLFTCKSLGDDNKCKDYKLRSIMCRLYPQINYKFINDGGEPLDGCGYKFGVSSKFKDYLKE